MGKRIKVFNSFGEMHEDDLKSRHEATPEERFDNFWKLKGQHRMLFGDKSEYTKDRRRITILKPEWI